MFKIIFVTIFCFIFSGMAQATTLTEKYSGLAHSKKGDVAYKEQHEVQFLDRQVQKASTSYLNQKDEVIGKMSSDFTKMVTIPDYEYTDLRTGISHGIKLDGESITLWIKNKAGELKESVLSKSKFTKDTLLVGCQGLHYYLINNLDLLKEKKTMPIVYFMPGRLDYYKFKLKFDREDEKYVYLKLSIDNFVLKLFTSSLDMKYRKSDRRLIQFSGLSNITNDKNEMQNVVIDYLYDPSNEVPL